MAAANNTNAHCLGDSSLTMAEFDELHPSARKVLRDAPYNIGPTKEYMGLAVQDGQKYAKIVQDFLPWAVRKASLEAYGPDHPQAKE